MQGVVPAAVSASKSIEFEAVPLGVAELGDILVSQSTDPDLVPLMRIAGAVVTEDGGVTCHAAVICRELEVPCVVGCQGVLSAIGDGTQLLVDGYSGRVDVIESGTGKGN